MALIKCSECGKEMSDKATTCPHCGARDKTGNAKAIRIILGIIILIISLYFLLSGINGM